MNPPIALSSRSGSHDIRPLERILPLLTGYKEKLNGRAGYTACCPAHQDRSPSFTIWEDPTDFHVGLCCFAGCSHKAILDALGIEEHDLYVNRKKFPSPKEGIVSLLDLAADKYIYPNFLANLGITDGHTYYHRHALHIPYYTLDGQPSARYRIRTALKAKDGSYWNSGSSAPLLPYGLQKLDLAREQQMLILVEGESDCWTLWQHGIPALGLPGAGSSGLLAKEYLHGINSLYVLQEPDGAGASFVQKTLAHLATLDFQGAIFILDLFAVTGKKDPNDLYKSEHGEFSGVFHRLLTQATPVTTYEQQQRGGLPTILLGDQLRHTRDEALAALARAHESSPSLFVQLSSLASVCRDKEERAILLPIGMAELRNALTDSANYYRVKKDGDAQDPADLLPVSPPKEVAELILALPPSEWPFQPLDAIVEIPVLRPDGTILDTPGYDRETRLYYLPAPGMERCKVPCFPTQEERTQALSLLNDAIGEFPYETQADRANALGMLLTPVIRPAIKGDTLMALLDATNPGTGKGYLSSIVSIIATGKRAAVLTAPDNDEEWDKRITAKLMAGATIIVIDNIPGRLQSSKLEAVLTTREYEGRVLGQSRMVRVINRATWIATGNNVFVGGDLARRCYRIRLISPVSNPEERDDFKIKDLMTWTEEHRAELVNALLVLARAWYAAGKPWAPGVLPLASFTDWVRTIGGILDYAGVPGFLENREEMRAESNEESSQWEAFLLAWDAVFGDEWILIAKLVERINGSSSVGGGDTHIMEALRQALPDFLKKALIEKPNSFAMTLARALGKRVKTAYGSQNMRIERAEDSHSKQKIWRVVR